MFSVISYINSPFKVHDKLYPGYNYVSWELKVVEFVQKSPDNAATANFAISKSLKIQTPLSFASSTLYRNTKHISESRHIYGVMEINIRIRIYRITLQAWYMLFGKLWMTKILNRFSQFLLPKVNLLLLVSIVKVGWNFFRSIQTCVGNHNLGCKRWRWWWWRCCHRWWWWWWCPRWWLQS